MILVYKKSNIKNDLIETFHAIKALGFLIFIEPLAMQVLKSTLIQKKKKKGTLILLKNYNFLSSSARHCNCMYVRTREIIKSSGGPRHLSTIPLKNFHLFKIAKSIINFYLKKISN